MTTENAKTPSLPEDVDYEFEAAFPTAVFVAAARGHDAASASPLIGRTIEGGHPDVCAKIFVDAAGTQLFHDFCAFFKLPPDSAAEGIATRTAYIDELLMKAYRVGTRQFVSLGAGLDARPWRLPLEDGATSVYEVDCPLGVRFKESRVKLLDPASSPLRCSRRVPVEADLSDALAWPAALVAAVGASPGWGGNLEVAPVPLNHPTWQRSFCACLTGPY